MDRDRVSITMCLPPVQDKDTPCLVMILRRGPATCCRKVRAYAQGGPGKALYFRHA